MLVMLMCIFTEVIATHCPHHCDCIWRDGKDAALCARAGFNELPNGLLPSTQLLDLSENPLKILKDYVFNDTGLLNLQRLYLTSCDIELVQSQTFWGLINLVELDLSKNKLTKVPSLAFFYIPGLRELKLSDNSIKSINNEAFQYLGDLVRLSLRSCKIIKIEPRGFFGLERSLQYLDLSHNNLRVINVSVVAPLRSLRDVSLAENPWNCTCLLRPMRDWMIKRNVPLTITPECAYPSRLGSQQWNRIDINEFVCYPKLTTITDNINGYEGTDITLACQVAAIPSPRIRWYRTGKLLGNSSANTASGRYYTIYSKGSTSHLTIKSAELNDAGEYKCVTENQAGTAEAIVTVTIKELESYFGKHRLFAWIFIVAVIAVTFCGIGLYLIEVKKEIRSFESNNEVNVSYHNEQIRIQNDDKGDVISEGAFEGGRKRGDYQNVPSHDPEDEAGSDKQQLAPLSHDSLKTQYGYKLRNYRESSLDPDLHIPRKSSFNQSVHAASSFFADKLNAPMRLASDNHDFSTNTGARYQKHNFSYSHISMTESEKNYPDLIEMSSYERPILKNEYKYEPHDVPIQRRKEGDSCSPLIHNSRRNSSEGDSVNYYEPYNKYRQSSWQRRSNSSSDLTIANNSTPHNPSLPVTPTRHRRTPSATPLLNINSLIKYSTPSYSTLDEFENQVFHMESLLNEYRTIGNQLNSSPKNTKDGLQKSRPVVGDETHNLRGNHSVPPSTALADAATPLTLNVAELNYHHQPVPERRPYRN